MQNHSLSAGIVAHTNSDFSGDVTFTLPADRVTQFISVGYTPDDPQLMMVTLPMDDILELAGRYMQMKDIDKIGAKSGAEYVESSLLMIDDPEEVPDDSPLDYAFGVERVVLRLDNPHCKLKNPCSYPHPHTHGTDL